jgi:hypothetical protein
MVERAIQAEMEQKRLAREKLKNEQAEAETSSAT